MKEKWIYLSHMLNRDTPAYGGKSDFEITEERSIKRGDKCNQLRFAMSNHTGTHIDLPYHFDPLGKKLEDYSPSFWFFNNVEWLEIDVSPGELILSSSLVDLSPEVECLLLKTDFEKFRSTEVYWNNNPGLSAEVGIFLKQRYKNLKVIGLDVISATAFKNKDEGKRAHQQFLGTTVGEPILIMEDMKLSPLQKGNKVEQIHIAPLLIETADGVPVTISAKVR